MLPAAVGFAAVLLLLLYSACLVETVDDEAILGLLTILPTYYPHTAHYGDIYFLWPCILWPYTYYAYAYCRRCSASSGAASGSTRRRYRTSRAISQTSSKPTAPSRIRSIKRWRAAPRRPAPQPRRPAPQPRRSHARHPPPSHQSTAPQVAYRKTTEGAGHVAQVRQPHAQSCSLQDT